MKIEVTKSEFNQLVDELAQILNSDLNPILDDATAARIAKAWREQAPTYVERHVAMAHGVGSRDFYEQCAKDNNRTARLLERLLAQAA